MADTKSTAERSTANRLAGLAAGQEQLQTDVEKIRGDLKAVLILTLYAAACGLLTFMAVRYGRKVVP